MNKLISGNKLTMIKEICRLNALHGGGAFTTDEMDLIDQLATQDDVLLAREVDDFVDVTEELLSSNTDVNKRDHSVAITEKMSTKDTPKETWGIRFHRELIDFEDSNDIKRMPDEEYFFIKAFISKERELAKREVIEKIEKYVIGDDWIVPPYKVVKCPANPFYTHDIAKKHELNKSKVQCYQCGRSFYYSVPDIRTKGKMRKLLATLREKEEIE